MNLSLLVLQADMLTQEAAYKQIQDAKSMVEDDLQHKLEEFEEERDRLVKLANTASSLERELEQVGATITSWSFLCFNLIVHHSDFLIHRF